MSEFLTTVFGVKLISLVSGFLGGVVRALVTPRITASQAFASCIVGAITAGYFTPQAVHWLTWLPSDGSEGAVGYVIGMTSMLICEGIIRMAKKWRDDPKFPEG